MDSGLALKEPSLHNLPLAERASDVLLAASHLRSSDLHDSRAAGHSGNLTSHHIMHCDSVRSAPGGARIALDPHGRRMA